MKISKVNHTKAGVGVENKQSKGILYKNPALNAEENINLQMHVEKLNQKAQGLYLIFTQTDRSSVKKSSRKKQYCGIMEFSRKEFEQKFLKNFKKNLAELPLKENISSQINLLDKWLNPANGGNLFKYRNLDGVNSEDIDDVVNICIRNSLRKYIKSSNHKSEIYFPDLIKKLLKTALQTEPGETELLSFEEKELLFQVLDEDYGKKETIRKIVNSIDAQNVHVSRVERNGKMRLQLSNAEHKNKGYVFGYLKKFAAANEEKEREEMLLHFKHLVLLFYCGKSRYEEALEASAEDLTPWNWRSFKEDEAVNFDDNAYRLINEKASLKDKNEQRMMEESIKKTVRDRIIRCYREAVKTDGITGEDRFWIQYIENHAEKLLLGKKDVNPVKLSTSYLCEHTYREWVSYICMKYIDMGKGVYHFTAPEDLRKVISGEAVIGEVLPEYREGITSFDYEKIKAEETRNRDISLYTAFAVNAFAMSVLDSNQRNKPGNEDVLLVSFKELEKVMYPDADRRILRFFGGKSTWRNGELDGISNLELVLAIQDALKSVRNSNFHYSAGELSVSENQNSVLDKLFKKEFSETGHSIVKKYYSNNVWMFYTEQDIRGLLDILYCREPERPAQVPAFNRIINKANMDEIIEKFILGKKKKKLYSAQNSLECRQQFSSTLFFILKEIYYYGFLQDVNIKKRFWDAVNQEEDSGEIKNADALKNFKEHLKEIEKCKQDISFGEICQRIMTDYNQQNQGCKSVTSGLKGHDKEKYKHFRMLLYVYLKKAFLRYLLDNSSKEVVTYRFLREPEIRETNTNGIAEDSFCKGWQPHMYDNLRGEVEQTKSLLAWYVVAHFLNQKQLNMLAGCVKNYIQYVQDIDRRCADTKNSVVKDTKQKAEKYQKVLSVLEFTRLFCGNISVCFEDYFQDEEEYAHHLASYVEFVKKGDTDYRLALKAFCSQRMEKSPTETIGLYYDELNPVINKNIVYAGMFGNEKLFRNCYNKITEKDIRNYYKKKDMLAEVFEHGTCKDIEQEKNLRKFQNQKNHIELAEITTFSEIVNDFMGQLISWAYLRERDLMYFQLGFHYMRLFFSDSVEESSILRQLKGTGIDIQDGAVLYQIIAMYTYDLPVLVLDEGGNALRKADMSGTGNSVTQFCKEYCKDKGEIYNLGLVLFENAAYEHDEIVAFRNYIDHFKYYSKMDRSIMDLYSDIYDRFFTYDVKLRKSVSFIFKNILMRYFVIADTAIQLGNSVRYESDKKKGSVKVKERAARLSVKYLKSDMFHLSKVEKNMVDKEEKNIEARDDRFLDQLQKILEYKDV